MYRDLIVFIIAAPIAAFMLTEKVSSKIRQSKLWFVWVLVYLYAAANAGVAFVNLLIYSGIDTTVDEHFEGLFLLCLSLVVLLVGGYRIWELFRELKRIREGESE